MRHRCRIRFGARVPEQQKTRAKNPSSLMSSGRSVTDTVSDCLGGRRLPEDSGS